MSKEKEEKTPVCRAIRARLLAMREESYRAFSAKLIPKLDPRAILGVRLPLLRAYAGELIRADADLSCSLGAFLSDLPHDFLEENLLHAFLIEKVDDPDRALAWTNAFLPYIDNWSVCDSFSPKVFAKNPDFLYPHVLRWLSDPHPFTQRYAIKMLMNVYKNDLFRPEQAELVAAHESEEYYVQMIQAWYFATKLAEREEEIFPYFSGDRLSLTVRRMAIRKALESFRVSRACKEALRAL